MQAVELTITPDGTLRFLVSEGAEAFLTEAAIVRRASHVEPVSVPLRLVFHGLRGIFGEKGRMAGFTRLWPCLWHINLSPIGRGVLPGTYRDRQAAIDAEIEELNASFI